VAFRYVTERHPAAGRESQRFVNDIAGYRERLRQHPNYAPHPEDAVDPLLGSTDGLGLFESILARVAA
jgi:phosphoribosylformylglycinamidine synthase